MNRPRRFRRARTPTVIQMEAVECGAAALTIIMGYYGKYLPLEEVRLECGISRDGSNSFDVLQAAKKYGMTAKGFKYDCEDLFDVELPVILFWEYNHFLVLEGFGKDKVYLNDPGGGPRQVTYEEFTESYAGVTLVISPGEEFQKGGRPLSLVKLLYERLKKTPKPLVFLFLSELCLLLPGFAFPAFLMIFIDSYFSSHIFSWKLEFIGLVFACLLFSGALSWSQLYFLNRLDTKLSMRFSSDFLWHLLKLPMSFYSQRESGEIAYRMSLNNVVAETITGPFITTVVNLILIFFFGIAMFFYDPVIASISVGLGAVNLATMYYIMRSRSTAYACLQQNLGKSIGQSIGGMYNIEAIKSKGIESDFFSKWAGYYTKNINSTQLIEKKDAILSTLPLFFQSIALAALLGIGSLRIIEGSLTVGALMALQILQINFLVPINHFVAISAMMQNMKKDIERLNDVLKNEIDPIYQERRIEKEDKLKLSGELEFINVSFQYAPLSPPIIQNLSFHLKPGKKIAFVGPSGCGKSTLVKLATGLYYPTSGQILYDGKPLSEISLELFRNSIASVDQEIFLFSGTIRENLTFWNNKVPDDILIEAATDADIHHDISVRENGYDSLLIEDGHNLSGGQRQRLEIARALLYKPAYLILDEATSALDGKTEEKVMGRIKERGSSLLMIAHRLQTIQDCEEIVVLDEGKVIQRGTHQELFAIPGYYQDLVKAENYND